MHKLLLAAALLATPAAWAYDIGNMMQEREQILRLRYNQEMAGASTASERKAISEAYKDRWNDNKGMAPSFDGAESKFGNYGTSSFADSLKASGTTSATLQPTLDYYSTDSEVDTQPLLQDTIPAGLY